VLSSLNFRGNGLLTRFKVQNQREKQQAKRSFPSAFEHMSRDAKQKILGKIIANRKTKGQSEVQKQRQAEMKKVHN
jgi:hypothetical protein